MEVSLGQLPKAVYPGSLIKLTGTNTTIQLPDDLPEGTTLQIERVEDIDLEGCEQAGDIFRFTFIYPDGQENYKGKFVLTLGVDKGKEDASIYYYNEKLKTWEFAGGNVKEGTITATVDHFSVYGVLKEITKEDDSPLKPLPKTATNYYNLLVIGSFFIILATIFLFFNQRRTLMNNKEQ